MKPYFQQGNITLYHADAREIMPSFAGVVITDPPYNIGYSYEGYKDNLPQEEYQELLRLTCRPQSVVIHYAEDLCALSWALEELPAKIVAWVYNSNTARQWRGVAWFGVTPDFRADGQEYKNPKDKRIAARIADGQQARLYDWWEFDQVKNVSAQKTEHNCQIPFALMERVVKITPGQTIIDPFAGSGTTLIAAKAQGRDCVGIERSERYCEIIARRLIGGGLFAGAV